MSKKATLEFQFNDDEDIVVRLKNIAEEIQSGNWTGDGWTISGDVGQISKEE